MPVARIVLPVAASTAFDYWIPEGLAVERGAIVRVRLAGRKLVGVVVEVVAASDIPRERLQPVAEAVRDVPVLPADLLDVAEFVSGYYQEPLGLVVAQIVPPLAPPRGMARVRSRAATALQLTRFRGRRPRPIARARAATARAVRGLESGARLDTDARGAGGAFAVSQERGAAMARCGLGGTRV